MLIKMRSSVPCLCRIFHEIARAFILFKNFPIVFFITYHKKKNNSSLIRFLYFDSACGLKPKYSRALNLFCNNVHAEIK